MERRQQQRQQQRGVCSFTPDLCAGCGAGVSICQPTIRLSITSTTGSPVEITVPRGDTVEGLRTRIAQKLRLQTEKIVLLHNDRTLTGGNLLDFGLADGSKLTLVPVIEAGLACSTRRPQRTVMDVLESLTQVQIDDFLSGRSPLNISLGVGAHMMYVQLQLSAQDVHELRQGEDEGVRSSSERKLSLQKTGSVSPPDSASTSTTGTTTLPFLNTSTPVLKTVDCASSVHHLCNPFSSSDPSFHSSSTDPAVNCHPSSLHTTSIQAFPSLPSGCPHPSCAAPAATPVCSPAPSGSSPGPPSPTPASTFTQGNFHVPPTAELCKQPGAVIESLVSPSPGVFSGTFSGALAPCSQTSVSHPRRGISVILRILNDLLKAAYNHQGALPTHPQYHSADSNPSNSQRLTAEGTSRPSKPQKNSGEGGHPLCSPTEENKTLHCKLEHLQFLMHQRRLRRQTRRNSKISQTSHPYQHRHCHP